MECSPGFLVCPAEPMQERWVCARLTSRHQGLICVYEPEAALTGLQAEGSVRMRGLVKL